MVNDGRRQSTSHRVREGDHSGDLHQALLRVVNEQIEQLNGKRGSESGDGILCECGHRGCVEKIEIAPAAYEAVRDDPTRFLVKPGHATAGSERIVEQTDGYLVVEKVGHAAEMAITARPAPTTAQRPPGAALTDATAATPAQTNGQLELRPKLILFYSPRSGISRRVDGYLAQVLQRRRNHATFAIVRIDADERPDLATRFKITTVPSLLVVDGNRVRARLSEPRGCVEIAELLSPWLT